MKSHKTASTLFYLASALYFVSAVINFIFDGSSSTGVIWLGLGASFLCVGTLFKRRADQKRKDKEVNGD